MKKLFSLLLVFAMVLTVGCARQPDAPAADAEASAPPAAENSAEETKLSVGEGFVTLSGSVGNYAMTLEQDGETSELVTDTLYEDDSEVVLEPVAEKLMGYDCFVERHHYDHSEWDMWYYYGIEERQAVLLGEGFGFDGEDADSIVADVDDDGITDLVSNVTYGGDGAQRCVVYSMDDDGSIMQWTMDVGLYLDDDVMVGEWAERYEQNEDGEGRFNLIHGDETFAMDFPEEFSAQLYRASTGDRTGSIAEGGDTAEGADFTVSVRKGENGLELLVSRDGQETVTTTDTLNSEDVGDTTVEVAAFADVLGRDGFVEKHFDSGDWGWWYYYGLTDGEPELLGKGFGFRDTDADEAADLNGDGENELIINGAYPEDQATALLIYARGKDGRISQWTVDTDRFIDDDFDWDQNRLYQHYDPEKGPELSILDSKDNPVQVWNLAWPDDFMEETDSEVW